MSTTLPWIQQSVGLPPWAAALVIVASGLIVRAPALIDAVSRLIAVWTATHAKEKSRRDSACAVLERLATNRRAGDIGQELEQRPAPRTEEGEAKDV